MVIQIWLLNPSKHMVCVLFDVLWPTNNSLSSQEIHLKWHLPTGSHGKNNALLSTLVTELLFKATQALFWSFLKTHLPSPMHTICMRCEDWKQTFQTGCQTSRYCGHLGTRAQAQIWLAGTFEWFVTYLILNLKELRHVYEAYTPLSHKKSHQAHFCEITRAQALNHFLELWGTVGHIIGSCELNSRWRPMKML